MLWPRLGGDWPAEAWAGASLRAPQSQTVCGSCLLLWVDAPAAWLQQWPQGRLLVCRRCARLPPLPAQKGGPRPEVEPVQLVGLARLWPVPHCGPAWSLSLRLSACPPAMRRRASSRAASLVASLRETLPCFFPWCLQYPAVPDCMSYARPAPQLRVVDARLRGAPFVAIIAPAPTSSFGAAPRLVGCCCCCS